MAEWARDRLLAGADLRLGSERFWHVADHGGNPGVCALAFSPSAPLLASLGYQDGWIRLWDVPSGRLLREWYCDHAGISGRVIFAPDGQTLATTNWSGWRLWDVHHGHLIVAGDREVVVGDLAFAPTGQLLAVTGHANQGGQLHLFSLPTGAWLHSFRIPPQRARPRGRGVREPPHLNGVAFSPNGAWLAAGGSDVGNESNTQTTPGHLFVWAVASGQQLAAWRAHTGRVLAVQFTPDGRLISAGADGLLCAWDAPTGTLLQTWTGTPGSAYAWPTITFDAAGRYACGPAWQYLGILRLDTPHRATDCV